MPDYQDDAGHQMIIKMINDDDDDGGGGAVVVVMMMMILTVISRRSMQATSLSAPGHPRPPGFTFQKFQFESIELKV